ncbi:MAG: GDYXXLXY domain-containing protein [Elusimicrobia bacterium]|nr:GDYXXLXY domain-containing protein [Elusimicrobiota bacterium]
MNKLKLLIIAQVAFFGLWGGYLLTVGKTAVPDIYLETEPVDPRDFLSGVYVSLTYAISTPEQCSGLINGRTGRPVYVKLELKGKTANTVSGQVPLYEASDCAEDPDHSGALWARGTAENFRGGPRVSYGIERFFVNENDPLKSSHSGQLVAKVKLDRFNNLRLEKLISKIIANGQ